MRGHDVRELSLKWFNKSNNNYTSQGIQMFIVLLLQLFCEPEIFQKKFLKRKGYYVN